MDIDLFGRLRGLDHLVLPVADLEAASARYAALGFQVGARNRHPWGTENRLVQFRHTFLEPIVYAGDKRPRKPAKGDFSFARFVDDFRRAHGEGFAMLVLGSTDDTDDQQKFDAAGIGGFRPFRFERAGVRADGSPMRVGFSLTFAADTALPDAGFFTCKQHNPADFWNPAFQRHDNGALDVTAAVMVAENPSDHHIFLSAFAGSRDIRSTSLGVTIPLARGGEIEVLTPRAFARVYGSEPPATPTPRFVAFRVATGDMAAATARALAAGGREIGDRVAVDACATLIVFEPAA
jgi:hypothetical protein